MIYKINKKFEESLIDELSFDYQDNEIYEEEDGLYCGTDCPEDRFAKIYARVACDEKTAEEKELFVTEEEAQDPEMLQFIQKCYNHEEYSVINAKELLDYEVIERDPADEKPWKYNVSVDPGLLLHEMHIRFYDAAMLRIGDKAVVKTSGCSENAFRKLENRVKCAEIEKKTGSPCLTEEESDDVVLRHAISSRYHFTSNLMLPYEQFEM